LTLIGNPNVIDKWRSEFKVLFRSHIAEFAEVVDQVRLVEVTGRETDIESTCKQRGRTRKRPPTRQDGKICLE